LKAFNCPQCAAVLEFERIEKSWVRCQYCNSLVVVPAELRPPPPQPAPESQITLGRGQQPKNAVLPVVGLLLGIFAVAVVIVVATALRSPNSNRVSVVPPFTPRATPTPTPTPKPQGYAVAYTFGGEGTGPGLFKDDLGVALDKEGRVYVSDETRRVQRFDASGQFVNTWSIPTQTKWYEKLRGGPSKIIVNERDEVYAVAAGVILKLDGETGEVLGAAHGSDYIHDAALAPGLGLYVVSQKGEDDELVLIGGDGRAARRTHRFVSSQLDKQLEVRAMRVAAGPGGEAYGLYCIGGVSGMFSYDDEDISVFKFSPEGKFLARFGGGENRGQPGQYGPPAAIAADPRGRVYVLETFNQLHVYEPDGRYVRTLKAPHGVESMAFDAQGALYLAGDHKVSKLVLDK
jgi:DNA-directed RNA polymerase subunit RPC12/RpoP